MNEQDEHLLQMVNENRQLLGLPPQTKAEAGFSCPNCAALEGEVARLQENVTRCAMSANDRTVELADMRREKDAVRALLRELAAATRAWDATLSEYCDGPEREQVRDLLRRAEAEAGEEKDDVCLE